MTITKAYLYSSIYKLFYNTIFDNLTNPHTGTTKYIYPAFPLNKVEDKDTYPLLVINSPDIKEEEFTFEDTEYQGEIKLTYFDTSVKDTDTYKDKILNCIENRTKTHFEANGIEFLKMEASPTTNFDHGAVKGHKFDLDFSFKVYLKRIN